MLKRLPLPDADARQRFIGLLIEAAIDAVTGANLDSENVPTGELPAADQLSITFIAQVAAREIANAENSNHHDTKPIC